MFGERKRKVSATTLKTKALQEKSLCQHIMRHQKIQTTWDSNACNDGTIKPISNFVNKMIMFVYLGMKRELPIGEMTNAFA